MDLLDDFFERAATLIEADPTWRSELAASRREFFPGRASSAADAGSRRRHLEWFLLERTDAHGPELALERALRAWAPELAEDDGVWTTALRESHVGVLEVTGVRPGEGLWLRDLGGRGEFPVAEDAASRVVEVGDLFAGRLFPIGGGVYRLSSGSAYHRDARMLEALRADFERARTERRGVLRVGQREIESLFFGGGPAGSADPVEDARRLLLDAGVEPDVVGGFLEELAQAPYDEGRLVHGAQDALSVILDELAFDSDVDIDAARSALLAAWARLAHAGPGSGPSLAPAPSPDRAAQPSADVARAVARFEERRRAGEPIAPLLEELERELALEGPSTADTDGDPTPDFPGVVGAVVEEFLWELSAREGPDAAVSHANLRDLGRATEHIGVFENLRARDLLVYAGWWLPENDVLGGADDARARMGSLAVFCRWAEAEHDVDLHAQFHATLALLGVTLPRVAEANQRRTRGARRDEGTLYEIQQIVGGALRIRTRSGQELEAEVEPDLAEWLVAGDWIRGTVRADGRLAAYCCYPPEVAELSRSVAE
jgi:hypothetical protein